jgi:hypothetical protein
MAMPTWINDFVTDLQLAPNGRLRMDCPVCNKSNTFSVTDTGTERMWYCFHADCHSRGRTGFRLRKDIPTHPLLKKAQTVIAPEKEAQNLFNIPDTFVALSRSEPAQSYVKRVGAYKAYQEGLADIRYDFRLNRVVYLIKKDGKVVDAAGRSLDNNIKPKWWRYGKSGYPFVCGHKSIGVILEDCASACSVSSTLTGLALLGTNLVSSYLDTIRRFDKVVVALDKDATSVALKMVSQLKPHVDVGMVILDKDVKDMNDDERKRTFSKYIS